MSIIAFDAAKRVTGWARKQVLFERTQNHPNGITRVEWVTGTVCPLDTQKLTQVIRRAVQAGCTKAAIENCYLGRSGNVQVVKALQDAQTRIRMACEMAELEVVLVYPQTWQSAFGIAGPSKDRKRGAQVIARNLGVVPYISEDEADAVCLCEYVSRNGHQEELELRGPRGGRMPWQRKAR